MDHCRNISPVSFFSENFFPVNFYDYFINIFYSAYFKIDEKKPVLVAGDPERIMMKNADASLGISYHVNQVIFAVRPTYLYT